MQGALKAAKDNSSKPARTTGIFTAGIAENDVWLSTKENSFGCVYILQVKGLDAVWLQKHSKQLQLISNGTKSPASKPEDSNSRQGCQ